MKKILIILCVMLLMTGCYAAEPKEQPMEKNKITISFWEPGTGKELSAGMQSVIQDYQALHPEIEVEILIYPVDEYADKLRGLYAKGKLPDIVSNHASELRVMSQAGLLMDLEEVLSEETAYTPDVPWRETYDGQFLKLANRLYGEGESYCIPIFNSETAVYYNKEIYQKLGLSIPKSWAELVHNFDVIEENDIEALALMTQKMDTMLWLEWEIANSLGLERILNNPKINLNEDAIISNYEIAQAVVSGELDYKNDSEIHAWYQDYSEYLKKLFTYNGSRYAGLSESVVKAIFMDGEVAHINTGSWDAASLLRDERFGVFRFPPIDEKNQSYALSHSAVQSVAVTVAAGETPERKRAVMDFLQFFTSKEEYQKFIDVSMQLPVIQDVMVSEPMKCFKNDGLASEMVLSYTGYDYIYKMLRGEEVLFDENFFKEMQQKAYRNAVNFLKSYPEQGYSEKKFVWERGRTDEK